MFVIIITDIYKESKHQAVCLQTDTKTYSAVQNITKNFTDRLSFVGGGEVIYSYVQKQFSEYR